jgi:predicted transcriptional regulator
MGMKDLTKAEEEVMQYVWKLKNAKVADIIEEMPEPKPAYNTVSTLIRILEQKGFVGYQKKGRGHVYFPKVEQAQYKNVSMKKLINTYFEGSFSSMVSFFMKKNDMSLTDLEQIMQELNKKEE